MGATLGFSAGIIENVGTLSNTNTDTVADEECRKIYGMSKANFKVMEETLRQYLRAEPR